MEGKRRDEEDMQDSLVLEEDMLLKLAVSTQKFREVYGSARLLKPMTFLETLAFCKRCLESWYFDWEPKYCLCFCCKRFFVYHFILNFLPQM